MNRFVFFILVVFYINHSWASCIEGTAFDNVATVDNKIIPYMQSTGATKASLAIMKNGRLVLLRTYNDASDISCIPLTSRFRIASLSKPITSASVMKLVESGVLNLNDKLIDLLPQVQVNPPVQDIESITLKHLLQHLGGWDRELTFDPMFHDDNIATALSKSLPITKDDILNYMKTQALQHPPGTTEAYSNYGYMLLGLIIEKVTGMSYESYVQNAILRPLGITNMQIGNSLTTLEDEVNYVSEESVPTVFSSQQNSVSAPYGGFNLENMDANGGWTASALDLSRFVQLFGDTNNPVLSQQTIETIFTLPENMSPDTYTPGDYYYAMGWAVRDYGAAGKNTYHFGSLPGTFTTIVRRKDGISWVFLANKRAANSIDIDGIMHNITNTITTWPEHDLFTKYYYKPLSSTILYLLD